MGIGSGIRQIYFTLAKLHLGSPKFSLRVCLVERMKKKKEKENSDEIENIVCKNLLSCPY